MAVLCCSLIVSVSLVSQLTLVKGLYIVQVQLHDYDNPTQQRFLGCNANECFTGCCDGSGVCTSGFRRCDTRFFFCLRPALNSPVTTDCDPNNNSVMQSNVENDNDENFDFTQSTFLGLTNPLIFQGLTNAWNGTRLDIIIRDRDSNGGTQLIDVIAIDIPVSSLGTPTGIDTHQGLARITEITLSVSVFCALRFQGSDCTQCIPGFTGAMCDEIDNCVGIMCNGNGQCVDGTNAFTCVCNPGFTGAMCEDNINECIDPGVNCSGNGQCVDVFGSYYCNCTTGYNGTNCEINIDDCSPDPCGANGLCIDRVDSFTCNCTTGYNGTLCDSDIDECLSSPCGMNQQCENQAGSFNCSCNPGFTGDLCQIDIDDCVGVNCSGNGICLDGVNSFTCQDIQGSPGIQVGPIIGGVLGGLIFLVLIPIIVVAVVLTMRCLNRQGKEGTEAYSDTLPGDNPMYDRGNTAVTFGALTQTSVPVHYVNLSSGDRPRDNMAGSAPDRVFDNPIYGGNDKETEDTYADPDANHHAGTGMGSSPYHEFDNPIYGGEADESSTYSLLADSNATRGGTHTTGSEQVYDHVN